MDVKGLHERLGDMASNQNRSIIWSAERSCFKMYTTIHTYTLTFITHIALHGMHVLNKRYLTFGVIA